VSDADLYEFLWTQFYELDGPGDPSPEFVDAVLAIPDGVSDGQFSRVLGEVERDRDGEANDDKIH
jgi:hypothetical protein